MKGYHQDLYFEIYKNLLNRDFKSVKNICEENNKKLSNLNYLLGKIDYISKNYENYIEPKKNLEITKNLWGNFFNCIKSNKFYTAKEQIDKIDELFNPQNDDYEISVYKFLMDELIELLDFKNEISKDVLICNRKILDITRNNLSLSDINTIDTYLEEKIKLKKEDCRDTFYDINARCIIDVINTLYRERHLSQNLFDVKEKINTNLNSFNETLSQGYYLDASLLLRNKETYDELNKNTDKIYPILYSKLFYYMIRLINKKTIKHKDSKYKKMLDFLENEEYDKAFELYLNNEYETDISKELLILKITK